MCIDDVASRPIEQLARRGHRAGVAGPSGSADVSSTTGFSLQKK